MPTMFKDPHNIHDKWYPSCNTLERAHADADLVAISNEEYSLIQEPVKDIEHDSWQTPLISKSRQGKLGIFEARDTRNILEQT